jgi:hypothetical protein
MVNFTQCANIYLSNQSLIDKWHWTGRVVTLERNETSQISVAGCRAVCGTTPEYYPWSQSSNTITTWILPVIGILLQAPFESNAFRRTLVAIVRWVGSPMASLSYILWNINVTGKCALMGKFCNMTPLMRILANSNDDS